MGRSRCLIISVSGIGNTILQSPLIETILHSGRFEVDCLFGSSAMASVFKGHSHIRHSFVLPKELGRLLGLYRTLLFEKYQFTVACFPSNRPPFHILPFMIRAKTRVIHDYGVHNCLLSGLSNKKVPAMDGIHDVEQNLGLLSCLEIAHPTAPYGLTFMIPKGDAEMARKALRDMGIGPGDRLLGLHAGAGPLRGKQWPLERFLKVATSLMAEKVFDRVLVFGGPEEEPKKVWLSKKIGSGRAHIVSAPINVVGGLIRECDLFLSNDTGLMHIAASVGTKVLGIFGPTNWQRTAPYGPHAHFIRPSRERITCAPCLEYPFRGSRPRFKCKDSFPCLESITVDQVLEAICRIL